MKIIRLFIVLMFIISFPSNVFALDITGWWKTETKPSKIIRKPITTLVKITDTKIYGAQYKVKLNTQNKIIIFIDNSETPCSLEKADENSVIFTDGYGEKKRYDLVTRDTKLSKMEVKKLLGLD